MMSSSPDLSEFQQLILLGTGICFNPDLGLIGPVGPLRQTG
jgi:hypothetical protein